ncbi:GGDEF domain-containing protein [Piscinibacter sp. HJYY11]|uniref:GGDEF domain-containing protein n=1 Tax=Piscinibacter sp. HJYY11 TaxID=2801333 RepID=UPI00191D4D77|nr:GGDEF domain-containing protein [Piscinibacter sp. HJYY11]MBL0728237.1 GGDEF domain-containing protein [Piscinibacter sp. HJYY11]
MLSFVSSRTWPTARMDDALRRRALRRMRLTVPMYLLSAVFTGWAYALGLLPLWAVLVQAAAWASFVLAFHVLLSSGVVWLRDDPMLVFPQVLCGIASIALCYAVNPAWRGYTLQMLFVVLVFDMQRLSRRQIVLAGWLAVGAMLLAVLGSALIGHGGDEFVEGLFFVGMAAVHVPVLSYLAGEVRGIRLRQEQSHRELDTALARLSEASLRDTLTGAYNRRHGLACLELELKRQGRREAPCAAALIDLDHFKQVNDLAGHEAGDVVLKTFARLAHEACTSDDVFIRWGGEEFLMLLGRGTDAIERLEALRVRVATHDWSRVVQGRTITFSAGVAFTRPGDDAAAVLARADQALYDAKHGGRNRVCQAPAHDVTAHG